MKNALERGIIIVIGILLQVLLTLLVYLFLISKLVVIHVVYDIIGLILILYLIKNSKNYSFTLPWIIILLLFPLIGTLLYIILGRNKFRSKTLKKIRLHERESKYYFIQDKKIKQLYKDNSKLKYISEYSKFPVTTNNKIDYYPLGEIAFKEMLSELKKAEKFIFFEYFIVNHGKMWDSILKILKQKAAEGVDVRVMYDDLGCMALLPKNYPKELEKMGIKCVCFNRLSAFAGVIMNNRDHRKILVIDGKVAFSGGINISDEYINIGSKYGHWKDNAIKIKGDAVWSYTVMFLSIWNSYTDEDSDFTVFKTHNRTNITNGFVAPYGETPLDDDVMGEDIYLNIINQANDYVYIFTPYLIIDTDMINSLVLAAKRGVDVRIVITGIPDKKIVYMVSESYVEALVKGGVKIYRYTPGFVHSKVFVSDDHIATVGTINMDYRSLYLHFECGCYMEDVDVINEIKDDLVKTIDKSKEISKEEARANIIKSFFQALLRLAAPLM